MIPSLPNVFFKQFRFAVVILAKCAENNRVTEVTNAVMTASFHVCSSPKLTP